MFEVGGLALVGVLEGSSRIFPYRRQASGLYRQGSQDARRGSIRGRTGRVGVRALMTEDDKKAFNSGKAMFEA
jgi:hypothetical protein